MIGGRYKEMEIETPGVRRCVKRTGNSEETSGVSERHVRQDPCAQKTQETHALHNGKVGVYDGLAERTAGTVQPEACN